MDTHDLDLAFHRKLLELVISEVTTARPDEVFDPETLSDTGVWRRGLVILNKPETIAFGDGVYSRLEGIYQIDLYVPRTKDSAFKLIKTLSDDHLEHFFPSDGRGLSVSENAVQANIVRRPNLQYLGREGAYLREIVEVDFYVDVPKES